MPHVNPRQVRYPWARPYYPTIRYRTTGGFLDFVVYATDPAPALSVYDIEAALQDIWGAVGNAPPVLVVSAHMKTRLDRKIRVWDRIRNHPRRANPRSKR